MNEVVNTRKTTGEKDKKSRKTKIKTPKVWTQDELKTLWADAWGVESIVLRQPRGEDLVFDSIEYLGIRRVRNTRYGGAYDAHHWRVYFLSELGELREFQNLGAVEMPCTKWNKNKAKGRINKEPEEVIGIHTITADCDGRIFTLEEGNKLE